MPKIKLPQKTPTIVRAYPHYSPANLAKVAKLKLLEAEYRDTAEKIASIQWRIFYQTGNFDLFGTSFLKDVPSKLSAGYKQNVNRHVVKQLKSFVSNRANDCISLMRDLTLTPEESLQVHTIHKHKFWYNPLVDTYKYPLERSMVNLARRMFVYELSRHKKPSFKNSNMFLNVNVAQVSTKGKSVIISKNSAQKFNRWVKVATLEKNVVVHLPLNFNSYYESSVGEECKSVQIAIEETTGEVTVTLFKEHDSLTGRYETCTEVVGLDFGLVNLLTTDNGDLLGRHFFDVIQKYDRIITRLVASRRKAGLPVKCPRYTKLTSKLREFLKNEVNRCLNKVILLYQPKKIVVENLNFENSRLSKRLNRIIRNCGRIFVREKLSHLKQYYGIEVVEVSPAYTSQTCSNSNCGYVAKTNRVSQSKFECKLCGLRMNADVNAARNIRFRSSIPELANKYTHRDTTLSLLVVNSCKKIEYEKMPPNSWASKILCSNKYYRSYIANVQNSQVQPEIKL